MQSNASVERRSGRDRRGTPAGVIRILFNSILAQGDELSRRAARIEELTLKVSNLQHQLETSDELMAEIVPRIHRAG